PIWISAAIPESMASLLAENTQFAISIPAYPTHAFQVEKWSILPSVDPNTRTLQVRLQVSNPDALLKPGMNAYLQLSTQGPEGLLIPSPAVIDTGSEQRVITVDRDGLFVPKIIKVSHESHGQTSVAAGLTEGESVVVNGLFLIDSEANISGALERMRSERSSAVVMPPANAHSGH
ncbi:MAG TPA: efflux RND transporter periplasmic adaptor subunit, partial [Plesiomonas shigelloides]|nr:efflux RND transporter periplasmic adaptor subunit [Plesiomonas shigelloides]